MAFPASPALNETYPPVNPLWKWDGAAWQRIEPSGGSSAPAADATPAVLTAVLASASAAFNNNPQTRGPSPLGVVVSSAGTLPGAFVREFDLAAAGHPFTTDGGLPVVSGGASKIVCVTPTGSTQTGLAWRVGAYVDGDAVTFRLDAANGAYRFLVDGQYVSTDPAPAQAGTWAYYTLTFPARRFAHVQVEGQEDARFGSAWVKEDGNVLPLPKRSRVVVVGDSNIAATGQTLKGNGFIRVAGDRLGIADFWLSGVAGTGFVAKNGGGSNNYSERRADWNTAGADMIVFTGSANDVSGGATAAQIKTACAAELTAARGANPGVPVLVVGMAGSREYFNSLGMLATFVAAENALSEAVAEAGDALIGFVPLLTVPGQTALTGTGTGTSGTDFYTAGDGHLTAVGHAFVGTYVAQRIIAAVAAMAGVQPPALAPTASDNQAGILLSQRGGAGAPPEGFVRLFNRKIADRNMVAMMGPSGLDAALQPLLARNKVGLWMPPGNATTVPGVLGFTAFTATGFTATARNVATTRMFTRMRRLGYVTVATAGTVGIARVAVAQITMGADDPTAGMPIGGFLKIIRFGISDAALIADARMFIGISNATGTQTNVEPSTLTNSIGVGHGAADTNLKLYWGGSAAQTPIDLGANFPVNTQNVDVYELALFAAPGAANNGAVGVQVTRLTTGDTFATSLAGTPGTQLPASNTLLSYSRNWRSNNASAIAAGIDIFGDYIETDQ